MPNPTIGRIAAILPSHTNPSEWITTPSFYCEDDIKYRYGCGADEISSYLEVAYVSGYNYKATKDLDGLIHNQKGTVYAFWLNGDPDNRIYYYQIWEDSAQLEEMSPDFRPNEDAVFTSSDVFADLGINKP